MTAQCEEQLIAEWRAYFSALLNNKSVIASKADPPRPAQSDHCDISTKNISLAEVIRAIDSLKRNRAPGPDYAMTAEVLKDGGKFIRAQLHTICQLVYSECHAPTQWTSSLIIPLPKKGNLQLMTNYRGISLMSIAAKVYNRVLLNRIRDPIDKILRKNQAGFRVGRSCVQQIHTLRRIIEGANSDNIPLYITFVDFKKAFDSIDRIMMFAILRHYGIPEKIVSAIRVLYDHSKSRVYVNGQSSEPFNITTGVLQGDVLAPFLFVIVIDYITKRAAEDYGYLTHKGTLSTNMHRPVRLATTTRLATSTRPVERKVNDLDFADDIALLENNRDRAQSQLDAQRREASTVGLEINASKTEQMCFNVPTDSAPPSHLLIDNETVKIVDDFKYLGSHMASTDKDISARIALAWVAFVKIRTILTSRKASIQLRMRFFNAACISILLYGCESWVLSEQQSNKLDVFARTCYRIMLGIRQSEVHMTNEQLYAEADNQRPITETIRMRQLQFTGHCLRMPIDEPANIYVLYTSNIAPTHRRGAPRKRYLDQISEYLCSDKTIKYNAIEIAEFAKDKKNWRRIAAPNKPDR